jgi:thymidylate synthase
MMAQVTGTVADECILTLNDAHIYHDHFDAVKEQLSREPMKLCTLWLNPEVKDIDGFKMDDIKLEDYESYPAIPAKMIV